MTMGRIYDFERGIQPLEIYYLLDGLKSSERYRLLMIDKISGDKREGVVSKEHIGLALDDFGSGKLFFMINGPLTHEELGARGF
ncbi:hypothetical protein GOV13_04770 [Candidatus Pacearchaeota archaeon]|nr:hypothetical protein [Candidatus Pacearchaeota archaeon]